MLTRTYGYENRVPNRLLKDIINLPNAKHNGIQLRKFKWLHKCLINQIKDLEKGLNLGSIVKSMILQKLKPRTQDTVIDHL